jgi:hypothetical protein
MTAVRSSGTRSFPVAATTPEIGAAVTISVSIALSAADWLTAGEVAAATVAVGGVDRLQAPHKAAAAISAIETVLG